MAGEKTTIPVLSEKIKNTHKMAQGFLPGEYHHGNYKVDTRVCTPEQADTFIKSGSKVIEKLPAAKPKAATQE